MADRLQPERERYSISEVSAKLEVPEHILRRWEGRIHHLKPKRDRANRRWYTPEDIEIARRIKHLTRHEKMTLDGVNLLLGQEIYGEGRPKTHRDVIGLLDAMDKDLRSIQKILDSVDIS